MNEPTLVVLAAGMGSRFGGLKQVAPLGPNQEIIIDYSLYDAHKAGFRNVVFVIKEEMREAFDEVLSHRIASKMNISYAFQDVTMLPEGFLLPEGRTKPWGTAHAVLCTAGIVKGNFGIINADDFYGADCYRKLYTFLGKARSKKPMDLCMVAYVLKNTLTENGTVSRGVCNVEGGLLRKVTERTNIRRVGEDGEYSTDDGENYVEIAGDTPVSMNVWGFTPHMLDYIKTGFEAFLADPTTDLLKDEFYLPYAVDNAIKDGLAQVNVLTSEDRWYGVTYADDKTSVAEALCNMHNEGKYPPLR